MSYGLELEEYCAEDKTYSARGRLEPPPDPAELVERAQKAGARPLPLPKLGALLVVAGPVSAHFHSDGRVILNGVKSVEEAERLLDSLLAPSA